MLTSLHLIELQLASYLKARMWNSCWAVDFWQHMSVRCGDVAQTLTENHSSAKSVKTRSLSADPHGDGKSQAKFPNPPNTSRASGRSSVADGDVYNC